MNDPASLPPAGCPVLGIFANMLMGAALWILMVLAAACL
jgi:hypothetical protein